MLPHQVVGELQSGSILPGVAVDQGETSGQNVRRNEVMSSGKSGEALFQVTWLGWRIGRQR